MQDVSQGEERNRLWPRKRPRRKTKEQKAREEKFRFANQATKYIAPQTLVAFTEGVRGTPLLPRDLIIQQLYQRTAAFTLPDGKTRFPVVAKTSVSQSLDVLSQTPGSILLRGEEFWEAAIPGGLPQWSVLMDVTVTEDTPYVETEVFAGISQVSCICLNAVTVGPRQRVLQVSTNGGASYLTAETDYQNTNADGIPNPSNAIFPQTPVSDQARSAQAQMQGLNLPIPGTYQEATRGRSGVIVGQTAPINRIRWIGLSLTIGYGALRSGRFIVIGA